MRRTLRTFCLSSGLAASLLGGSAAFAAKPTAEQALQLAPLQAEVDIDRPNKTEAAQCVVEVENEGAASGWMVKTAGGELLRRFLDTNGDNKIDHWCYFKDGIEVYRDIDANFNNKADQYRWLGTAGTRWGLDRDEDGRIDAWKEISAEEASAEIVAAVRDQDVARFRAVLLTAAEIDALGLDKTQTDELKKTSAAALTGFAELVKKQTVVRPKSQWVNFGASRPGTIPGGTAGAKNDVVVYDNVAAVIETEGKHSQLLVGALVRVGNGWKAIELPKNLSGDDSAAVAGRFFQATPARGGAAEVEPAVPVGVNVAIQKHILELEKIDKALIASRSPLEQGKLNGQRADVLDSILAGVTTAEDRDLWVRQYAETVNAAIQTGAFPDGLDRLQRLSTLVSRWNDKSLLAYVKFRCLSAEYNLSMAKAKADDFQKINDKWINGLETFVEDYSMADEAAEAKLQLAISSEFSGKEEEAVKWYGRIVTDHPSSEVAKKAAGAKRRLQSVGQPLSMKAKTLDGRQFDLAAYKGKGVVLIHYWADWCEPCKADMDVIKQAQAKYGKRGFYPIGISLDTTEKDALAFLKAKPLPWVQLYETGGLEGRLATELGILTLPTMILVDENGKVVNRAIHAQELDAELGKILK